MEVVGNRERGIKLEERGNGKRKNGLVRFDGKDE